VERSKRYSRKPGPEGDARNIKFKFQELWLLAKIFPYVEMTILCGYFAWASTSLSLTRLSIKNPFKSVFSQSESASSAFNIGDLLCMGFDFAQPGNIEFNIIIKNPFKSVFSQSESASSAFYIVDLLYVGFDFAQPDNRESKTQKSIIKKIPPQLRNGIAMIFSFFYFKLLQQFLVATEFDF
jgi:hypothetical protein